MFNGFSDFWQDAAINHMFGIVEYTAPAHTYLGASTTDPGEDGTDVAEPTDAAYVRVEMAPGDWTQSEGGQGSVENTNPVQFAQTTENWGEILSTPIFDQALGAAQAITGVDAGTSTFTIAGEHAVDFPAGSLFCIRDSMANDGNWTVVSATDDTDTDIVVVETIGDETVDGDIYSMGHFIAAGPLTHARDVYSGDIPTWPAGTISVAEIKST